MDRRLQTRNLPAVLGRAAIAIGLLEQQIPAGVESVDLELAIIVITAGGVDENLEIIVLENNGIVLGERAPDMRLLQLGRACKNTCRPKAS